MSKLGAQKIRSNHTQSRERLYTDNHLQPDSAKNTDEASIHVQDMLKKNDNKGSHISDLGTPQVNTEKPPIREPYKAVGRNYGNDYKT